MADYRLPNGLGGVESVARRYKAALAKRDLWSSLYREAYRFAVPSRELFNNYADGQDKESELFDSTAVDAVQEFASRIQANIMPAWRQWSKLEPGPGLPKEQRDSEELKRGLEDQTEIFFSYINHSNCVQKTHESFVDLAVGTACLTLDLNQLNDGLQFDCIPIAHLAIEDSPAGVIETVFEDKKTALRNLKRMYGGEVSLPPGWSGKKDEEDVSWVQSQIYDPKAKRYHLCAFATAPNHVLFHQELGETGPYIVFRWSVVPGETHGRGPVLSALADIKTLNKVVEFTLAGAALTLFPPMTGVGDGVLNPYTVTIAPNTVIPVASNDQNNPSLKPLVNQPRPDLAQMILTDMRMSIRKKLLVDNRRQEGPVQSATEIVVQDREFVAQTGANYGRIQAELVERVIARGIDLLRSIGKMANIRVDGKMVTLKHTSPLARAQDNEELMAAQSFFQLASTLAGPEAYQLSVKTDEISEWLARKTGFPAELIRTADERQEAIQKITEAAATAQQNAQASGQPLDPQSAAAGNMAQAFQQQNPNGGMPPVRMQ